MSSKLRLRARLCLALTALLVMPGTALGALGARSVAATAPAQSQPAGEIAYTQGGNIWLFDLTTRQSRQLSNHPSTSDPNLAPVHLSWSPDGQRLAYSKAESTTSPSFLWLVEVATGQATPLVQSVYDFTWAPDSLHLVYNNSGDLYSIPIDGSELIPLVSSPFGDYAPAFAPDGTLFFLREIDEGGLSNFVVVRRGSDGDETVVYDTNLHTGDVRRRRPERFFGLALVLLSILRFAR
jgi:WD40 repeat protein